MTVFRMKHFPFILCWFFIFITAEFIPDFTAKLPQQASIESTRRCPQPLTWKIGAIDPRFDINRETLKNMMADIGDLWSNAAGKNLIVYSDSGRVTINFIYGREQKITDSERQLSQRIDQLKLQHRSLEHRYKSVFYSHEDQLDEYDRKLEAYKKQIEEYNWLMLRRSDASVVEDLENERLIKFKKRIKSLKDELDTLEKTLNDEVKKLAQLSGQLDDAANRVNKLIFSFNDRFGSARTFYQGVYIDDLNHQKINIHEYENTDKLRLVLAHEAGHALGLSHVSNPTSIMYFKMEYQNEQTLHLSEEDVRAIRNVCGSKGGG